MVLCIVVGIGDRHPVGLEDEVFFGNGGTKLAIILVNVISLADI